jgi:hypothetical protein
MYSTLGHLSDFDPDFTDEIGELDEVLLPAARPLARPFRTEYLFMDERVFNTSCSWSETLEAMGTKVGVMA